MCLALVLTAILVTPVGAAIGGGSGVLLIFLAVVAIAVGLVGLFGLIAIAPNDSRVLLLFSERS